MSSGDNIIKKGRCSKYYKYMVPFLLILFGAAVLMLILFAADVQW